MSRLLRTVAFVACSFIGITLVTFALLNHSPPILALTDPDAPRLDPSAKARAARLTERYALDRPAFFNAAPRDATHQPGGAPPPVDRARVGEWFAAARAEADGGGAARRESAEAALADAGRGLVPAFFPRLLDEDPRVLARGLAWLERTAPIPAFEKPAKPRDVALWWRRHADEFVDRGAFWRATIGHVIQTRYAAWLGDLLRLDFGDSLSIRPEAPVLDLIKERLPATLGVMAVAIAVLFLVGVPLGLALAARRGGPFDRVVQGVLFVLHAMPEFWVATLCLIYLCSDAHWRLFPVGGLSSPDVAEAVASGALHAWSPRAILDRVHHLVLPVLMLVFPAWVIVARHVRAAAIEALGARFVTAARARGIPPRRILFGHVLRSCAPPTIALFTSVLPVLVTGSILIEVLFSLDGMGFLSWQAALQSDFPVGMAVLVLVALVMLIAHVLTDAVHGLIDPRVRTS